MNRRDIFKSFLGLSVAGCAGNEIFRLEDKPKMDHKPLVPWGKVNKGLGPYNSNDRYYDYWLADHYDEWLDIHDKDGWHR